MEFELILNRNDSWIDLNLYIYISIYIWKEFNTTCWWTWIDVNWYWIHFEWILNGNEFWMDFNDSNRFWTDLHWFEWILNRNDCLMDSNAFYMDFNGVWNGFEWRLNGNEFWKDFNLVQLIWIDFELMIIDF